MSVLSNQDASAFPREVRDRIYQFFFPPTLNDVYFLESYSLLEDHQQAIQCFNADNPGKYLKSHWFSPRFVGLEVAKEITQAFYESCRFVIRQSKDPAFLCDDIFRLGLLPEHFIRQLEVCIPINRFESKEWPVDDPEVYFDKDGLEPVFYESLKANLQVLGEVPNKSTIDLTIMIEGTCRKPLTRILEVLRPCVDELQKHYSRVTVEHDQNLWGRAINTDLFMTSSEERSAKLRSYAEQFHQRCPVDRRRELRYRAWTALQSDYDGADYEWDSGLSDDDIDLSHDIEFSDDIDEVDYY